MSAPLTADLTIPMCLLRDPSKATEFQAELMRGISHAEANGFDETRRALTWLLNRSMLPSHGGGAVMPDDWGQRAS